ncbi:hypothetical protein HYV87_01385 [Candidatus Woesearchaeota archaeon]|nr:hypothetical protein [Candidatus Woesearchaeota archaeon]
MPDYDIPRITLRYNGIFDFDGFYNAVTDWAKNYGFMWHESSFKHKVPSSEGAEQELAWQMTKKVTEFIEYTIIFTIHMWEVKDVPVEGRKKPLMRARLYIWIEGKITYDWQKKYGGSKFAELLGKWLMKLPHMNPVETMYFDQLYYRVWNLHAVIKKYFDLQAGKNAYKDYLKEN